jgi:hypothetical protein
MSTIPSEKITSLYEEHQNIEKELLEAKKAQSNFIKEK